MPPMAWQLAGRSLASYRLIKILSLCKIEGPHEVGTDRSLKFDEKSRIYYATVTVQFLEGERVPFLFTIKELVANGKPDPFNGKFLVPSYRGSSFLDPKGHGGFTGISGVFESLQSFDIDLGSKAPKDVRV
ncbi:hypothetical protein L7F22_035542 [Adiantum nelumboides]|nr:hypothetical protein [Adiantum nelumboides]